MKTKKNKIIVITISIVSLIILTMFLFDNSDLHMASMERPQEPLKPYPYYSEEVTFKNTQENITLQGTLTMPSKNGNYPVVILISGSGPQNRDYEYSGHKPFLILANYLTTNGIAVLRYDDRDFGKSIDVINKSSITDFSTDITSAISYLKTRKEIIKNKIGLIGHSEGGIVASMVAASCNDVNFIILLGAPGIEGSKIMLKQFELYPKVLGASKSEIRKYNTRMKQVVKMVSNSENRVDLKTNLTKLLNETYDKTPAVMIPKNVSKKLHIEYSANRLSSASFIELLNYDPEPILSKVTCPVLALNGEKDIQVTPNENLVGIKTLLLKNGNTNVTIKEIPSLNHFFQECKTGSPMEYKTIEQTFSPIALKEISDWILGKVK